LEDRTPHREDLFGSLLAALLRPAEGDAVLVGYQPPLAVLELPGEGAGVVVLDSAGAAPDEVAQRAQRIIAAHQGGLLTLVVTGAGEELVAPLVAADKAAPDPARLSVYHFDRSRSLKRLAGRRTPVVEGAARAASTTPPLPLAEVPALIARGQREREEAVNFAAQLAGRKPRVTMALVGACVLMFVLEKLWSGGRWDLLLLRMGGNSYEAVADGQAWRLLASAFLHGDETHLLVNMLGLWSFGGFIEPVLRWQRYLIIYGVSALVGSLASAFIGRTELSVGASGALWGLMLAGFALARVRGSLLPARIARQLRQRLVIILAINVALTFAFPRIDKFAHFGGGLAGFVLVASGLLVPRSLVALDDEPGWVRVLAPWMAALMAFSVAAALLVGRPWMRLAAS
jgi:membrane associated rhomboid family serine protease